MLVALVLLWPSSTAGPEQDSRPPWLDAQLEFEARLRDVIERSKSVEVKHSLWGSGHEPDCLRCRGLPI
ncbi:hypothetical protein DAT35_37495 [Vitiosangium sp. GDMCC 1.1324]|nr:hypothetical protein DAT35_37495 [Vitiosangium sp. GDMCC 1.1324]